MSREIFSKKICISVLTMSVLALTACSQRAEAAQTQNSTITETPAVVAAETKGSGAQFSLEISADGHTYKAGPGAPVSANAETTTESAAETIKETTAPAETKPDYSSMVVGIMFAKDTINVRKDPSTDSEVLGQIAPDSNVSIVKTVSDEWAQVVYENQLGYVARQYITDDRDWRQNLQTGNGYTSGAAVGLDTSWKYAEYSVINSGNAVMYLAPTDRKGIVVGINAGHGTSGGDSVKTWCHPDQTPKVTGGTTSAGATKAVAVSSGMNFSDGTPERKVTLREAQIVRDLLLQKGYDVLMIRDGDDVQLDNVARTVICNNVADCHIAIHWDGDGLGYDKGCFYMSVPEGIKYLPSVASVWQKSERLGECCISGLSDAGNKIFSSGSMDMDLTQTSYSTVPSIDIELGNQSSDHSEEKLYKLAEGLVLGIDRYFNNL
ncbi:MAG: N-acetylmuramoyl-L-alanine amidase [Eubacteriales bacterium]|nr:N-acetylmuramoyl-L-alanine amidase [Eubacteriales bacterium]